jgi:hypothetical protein
MRTDRQDDERFFRNLLLVWSLGVLATVTFWGVVIWAIVTLVRHFTGA